MGQFQQTCVPPSLPEAKPSQDGRELPGPCGPARRLRRRPRERERELDEVSANDVYNINLDFNFIFFTSVVISKFAVIGACPKFKLNTR